MSDRLMVFNLLIKCHCFVILNGRLDVENKLLKSLLFKMSIFLIAEYGICSTSIDVSPNKELPVNTAVR